MCALVKILNDAQQYIFAYNIRRVKASDAYKNFNFNYYFEISEI